MRLRIKPNKAIQWQTAVCGLLAGELVVYRNSRANEWSSINYIQPLYSFLENTSDNLMKLFVERLKDKGWVWCHDHGDNTAIKSIGFPRYFFETISVPSTNNARVKLSKLIFTFPLPNYLRWRASFPADGALCHFRSFTWGTFQSQFYHSLSLCSLPDQEVDRGPQSLTPSTLPLQRAISAYFALIL